MNKHLLETRSLSKSNAYIFFFLASHYAYFGKWGMQLLYWFLLFNGIGLIWAVYQFFAIPNNIKEHNLKVYEELLNS